MNPDLYAKGNQISYRDSSKLIVKYVPLIKWPTTKNLTAIDIGCGTGNVTWEILRPLLPEGVQLYAADVQPKMIEFVAAHYPELKCFVLDVSASNIAEHLHEAFDCVFSFYCLMCITDTRQGLQNIYNMIKPDGHIFTYFFGSHVFIDTFYQLSTTNKWKYYMPDIKKIMSFYEFDEENLQEYFQRTLEDIGFKISICEVEFRNFIASDIEELKSYFKAVCPGYLNVPENLREEFINNAFEILYQHKNWKKMNENHSNQILIPHRLILLLAKKPKKC